jgi:hypothetical protein
MAEKVFAENIKSRKFQSLTDEGSFGKAWMEIKLQLATIENNSENLTAKYKEYVDAITKDLKEYEIATKSLENDYNLIKKKKDTALAQVTTVFLFYLYIFVIYYSKNYILHRERRNIIKLSKTGMKQKRMLYKHAMKALEHQKQRRLPHFSFFFVCLISVLVLILMFSFIICFIYLLF